MVKLPIETVNPLFGLVLYPIAEEIKDKQLDVIWTSKEVPVEKDVHDFRFNMLPEQYSMASVTLDLFVEIEQKVGNVWNTIGTWLPHSEIDGACSIISAMEKSVHASFYQKMSDEMNIPPEVTAANQQTITVLRHKLELLNKITSNLEANKPLSFATVAIIEQVLLFSNFAMLKSFQANGNNLITNTVTGVDFVVQDEMLHGVFASYLHNTWWDEVGSVDSNHEHLVHNTIREVIAHEDAVIDFIYKDIKSINDVTPAQLKAFTRSRADIVLEDMKLSTLYGITTNPIAEWFYKSASSIRIHDFFVSGTSQYRRGWKTENLSRLQLIKGVTNV
jgi:ribonucleotide reductase beta subunit family protein with ferritin-like domain